MLRFLTAGESHGPELTLIIDGLPAGIPIERSEIDSHLARRQKGLGSGARMSIERDSARITAGVTAGVTTGGPVCIVVANRDFANWREKDIPPMTIPRPGHVDLNAAIKYGYDDLRIGLERASARETAARVAMGAVCRAFLKVFGVIVGSYVHGIGAVAAEIPPDPDLCALFESAESDPVRCPDPKASASMQAAIEQARLQGDTLGGVFTLFARGVPCGLGSHAQWDRRLGPALIAAVGSIPAIKGVEIGDAFELSAMSGTQVHDAIRRDAEGRLFRETNRSGGLEGGITTGADIVVRAAMKPISTTMAGIESVDLISGAPTKNKYERSDICAVPRAAVVGEAMIAFVIAGALIEKLGGDSIAETAPRFAQLATPHLRNIHLHGVPWRFEYPVSSDPE